MLAGTSRIPQLFRKGQQDPVAGEVKIEKQDLFCAVEAREIEHLPVVDEIRAGSRLFA